MDNNTLTSRNGWSVYVQVHANKSTHPEILSLVVKPVSKPMTVATLPSEYDKVE